MGSGVDALPVDLGRGLDDEVLARGHLVAHEQLEDALGGLEVAHRHLAQGAVARIHGRVCELVGVHLTEALVALHRLLDLLPRLLEAGERAAHLRLVEGVDQLVLLRPGVDHLEPVQRRHRRIDAAGVDERAHVAEEERQQQRADVGAVDVGVGHDDDLAVARRRQVEAPAGAGPDDLDDRGALGVLEHVGHRRLLDVEDLAADRQQRLELGAACLLRGAHRRVALDDEQLRALDVGGAAVAQLGRQGRALEGVLAPLGLLVQPRADARLHLGNDLLEQQRRLGLVAALGRRQPVGQLLLDDLGHDGAYGVGAEHLLGLALELRLGQAHRHDGGHAGEDVVLLGLVVADLEPPAVDLDLLAEDLDDRLLEAGDVGAALGRRDDVDEGLELRVVALPPAQRYLDGALALELGRGHVAVDVEDRNGLGEGAGALEAPHVGDRGVGREELDEVGDAAVVLEDLLDRALLAGRALEAALVADDETQAGAEDGVVVELGVLEEDLPVGPEAHPRAGDTTLRLADDRQRALLLVGGDLDVEPCGQRVDDGRPDPVEATRGGIRRATELATRVQLREDHLDTGQAGPGLDVDGDAATVVPDLDGAVAAEDHLDTGADAGQGLVDRVVDDLPQAVHEAALVGRADVHARALAHGLEALEDLEVARGVVAVAGGSRSGGGGHVCRSLSVGNGQRSGCGGAGSGSLATPTDRPPEARWAGGPSTAGAAANHRRVTMLCGWRLNLRA